MNRRAAPAGRLGGAILALVVGLASPMATDGAATGAGQTARASIAPDVEARLQEGTAPLDVIAILRDRVDLSPRAHGNRAQREREVAGALHEVADRSQVGLRTRLAVLRRSGLVQRAVPLWIMNAIAVTAPAGIIRELAARPEVAAIVNDAIIQAPASRESAAVGAPIEPNIARIGAPALWAAGFTGQGVVVASVDTGVDLSSPDLAASWRGGADSWYDPYGQHPTTPTDRSGHGTSTMGVIVGGSATGTQIGVAPGARWIAAKAFNDAGLATTSGLHLAYQWLLDPDGNPSTPDAPDVVNDSWVISSPGCSLDFAPDLAALTAAGILPVFAAGNFGPGANTDASPANNPGAFAVGSTDNTDVAASFSSRGPTSCGRPSAATFPDLVAPGVAVNTTDLYGLTTTTSGTSISAPHVTGAIALLLSAFPSLTIEQQRAALVAGAADLGPAGPDATFGAGRLDVAASYAWLGGGGSVPPTNSTGPVTSGLIVNPSTTTGSTPVSVAATVDDATSGGSSIDAAELFVDVAGANGSGRLMAGAYGPGRVNVTGTLDVATLSSLASGTHAVLVHGRDGAGNWGPFVSASLSITIDRSGPVLTGAVASPAITRGAATVTVSATADDPAGVRAAEWFVDSDPGVGLGGAMLATDGAFDASHEALRAVISTTGLAAGEHLVGVRARDGVGNWDAAVFTSTIVAPADTIFADGFESNGVGAWSSSTGSSALTVTSAAATAGRYGLSIRLSRNAAYLTDTTPSALTTLSREVHPRRRCCRDGREGSHDLRRERGERERHRGPGGSSVDRRTRDPRPGDPIGRYLDDGVDRPAGRSADDRDRLRGCPERVIGASDRWRPDGPVADRHELGVGSRRSASAHPRVCPTRRRAASRSIASSRRGHRRSGRRPPRIPTRPDGDAGRWERPGPDLRPTPGSGFVRVHGEPVVVLDSDPVTPVGSIFETFSGGGASITRG